MPTSSQAMILMSADVGTELSKANLNVDTSAPMAFGIVNMYDVKPLWQEQKIWKPSSSSLKGKLSAPQLTKPSSPLHNILYFDPESKSFKWHPIDGEIVTDSHTLPPLSNGSSSPADRSSLRPKTAGAFATINNRPQNMEKEFQEALVHLGFRPNAADLRASYIDLVHQNLRHQCSVPIIAKKSKLYQPKRYNQQPTDTSAEDEESYEDFQTSEKHIPECHFRDVEDQYYSDTEEYEVEFDRIRPSIYMSEHKHDARPRAAILSFRDNDSYTHFDVKHLVELQLGLEVKGVQYDPLPVRCGRIDMYSRWIVTFASAFELDQAVKRGLKVGRDKIIMYKFDNIASREHKSFKYFQTIQDAKKRLNRTKSVGHHIRQHTTKLRGAKSEACPGMIQGRALKQTFLST